MVGKPNNFKCIYYAFINIFMSSMLSFYQYNSHKSSYILHTGPVGFSLDCWLILFQICKSLYKTTKKMYVKNKQAWIKV